LRGEEEASVNGVRITAAKCERWEKRARIDEEQKSTRTKNAVEAFDTPSSVTHSDSVSCNSSTDLPSTSRHEQSSDMLIVSPSKPPKDQVNSFTHYGSTEDQPSPSLSVSSTEATNPGFSPSALLMGSSEPLGSLSNAHVNIGTVQETEQHFVSPSPLQSSDRDVDIVTRLFSALKMNPINIPLHIPPTQAVAEVLTPATDTVCLQDLEACSHDGGIVTWVDKQAKPYKTASSGSTEVTRYHNEEKAQQGTIILVSYQCSSRKRTTTGALKYPSVDVIFSSSRVVELDPFSLEVYPFPQDQGRWLEVQPIATEYDVDRMTLNDCIAKIDKLESAALGSNITTTELRWSSANAYYNLSHYDKAEHQYKQVLPVLEQIHGQNSWDYISAKVHLAGSVLHLGRSQEGNQIAQEAHVLARRFFPSSFLYQEAARVLANSFASMHDFGSEEELLRDLFQIRLTISGPKHGKTIQVIRKLCILLTETKRHSESEALLRVALELSSNATGISDWEQCVMQCELGRLLYHQHKYADSEALLRDTAKMSERLLGIEHEETLRCKTYLCRVLTARKQFSEIHNILLETIDLHAKKLNEIRGSTIDVMAKLSVVLIEMRKMDDAYKWMKQALCYCVEIDGIESNRAEQFLEDFRSIDEQEEQHELILHMYEGMAYKISWIHAVLRNRVLSALSTQPCLLLLDFQRKSSCLSAPATDTRCLHNGPVS
jgi:tetratricopeptide (TPR) repeat protein